MATRWVKTENGSEYDYFVTKKAVIRFIARVTGTPARFFATDVVAKGDSEIKCDSKGWRASIIYE